MVYKAVEPFEKDDEAVKELRKGNISAHIRRNLQSVSMNHTVKVRACTANRVHFVLDVPSRGAGPFHVYYATERRYVGLAKTARMWAIESLLIALLCCVLVRITYSPVFAALGVICSFVTILAVVINWGFERKAKGKFILIRDDEDDGYIIIDSGDDSTSPSELPRALKLE
ncbi:hypothetical protein V7S43_015995 [Phytophthora oleae]|uniref:Uncharacterized protein n=1 Tax=Phytophthora oleae TaxID=2107226 RepID=A0ABD3F0H9_9STRA